MGDYQGSSVCTGTSDFIGRVVCCRFGVSCNPAVASCTFGSISRAAFQTALENETNLPKDDIGRRIHMIRQMESEDLTQCGAIYAKAFPMEHWGIDWTNENATEYLSDFFEQKKFIGYVYEENNEIIGCIFALCKISGSKKEIYVNEMAVLPDRQGHGIGKQLLHTVLEHSREMGSAGVVLYTSEYAPAAKFYEKNGFQVSQGTICMYWD